MPQNYTPGAEVDISARPNLTISEPVGTDVRNSASIRGPIETIANYVHTLLKKAGLLHVASTWTAKQTFDTPDDANDYAPINLAPQASDPASPVNGDVWVHTDGQLKWRGAGLTRSGGGAVRGRWHTTTPGYNSGGSIVGGDGGTTITQAAPTAYGTFTITDSRISATSVFLITMHASGATTEARVVTSAGSAAVTILKGGVQSNEDFSFAFYP